MGVIWRLAASAQTGACGARINSDAEAGLPILRPAEPAAPPSRPATLPPQPPDGR